MGAVTSEKGAAQKAARKPSAKGARKDPGQPMTRCWCATDSAAEAADLLERGIPKGTPFFLGLENAIETGGAFAIEVRMPSAWLSDAGAGMMRADKAILSRRIEGVMYAAVLRRQDDGFSEAPARLREIAGSDGAGNGAVHQE